MTTDQVIHLADGWFAIVGGKQYGPWALKEYAIAGMHTEQRRREAAAKQATIKVHPADARMAGIIADAVAWTAYIRVGPAFKSRVECPDRTTARAEAQALANRHGRPAMVYAVNARGSDALADTVHPQRPEARI